MRISVFTPTHDPKYLPEIWEELKDQVSRLVKFCYTTTISSFHNAMKNIPLRDGSGVGKEAIVDDEFYEELSQHKWYVNAQGYPTRRVMIDGKRYLWRMHWSVIGKPGAGMNTDHINQNPSDNRKENLRFSTKAENGRNRGPNKNNTSGYKGVSWFPRDQKWTAQITVDRKNKRLGYFEKKEDAARAYNVAALRLHGPFAKLNEI